jgi:hypothetical protein
VKDGVRCELVKLHTINEEKPTKKLVGRKRKAAEEEGKEHYPITARGLRDPFSAVELNGIAARDEAVRPGLLYLLLRDGRAYLASRGGCLGHGVLGRKVLHAHLPIHAWGLSTRGEGNRDRQWRRRRRERAGKQYKSSTIPLYTFSEKEHGLRRGARSGNDSPLTGREI